MEALIGSIVVFVLAMFVGFEVITKVPPTLHTPLMSGSNAVSGITIIGALLSVAAGGTLPTILGFLALVSVLPLVSLLAWAHSQTLAMVVLIVKQHHSDILLRLLAFVILLPVSWLASRSLHGTGAGRSHRGAGALLARRQLP